MRKLLRLAVFLLCLALPALAEDAVTVPQWAVGEWQRVLLVNGEKLISVFNSDEPSLIITTDGVLTYDAEDAPACPLQCDPMTGGWFYQYPDDGQKVMLLRDNFNSRQLCLAADPEHLLFLARTDASPARLPVLLEPSSMACGGSWKAKKLYLWGDASDDSFAGEVALDTDYVDGRLLDTPVITLPAFPDIETVQQAWTEALARYTGSFPIQALRDIYGYTLHGERNLLLVTSYGFVALTRSSTPEVDNAIAEQAEKMAGWWYPDELSIGSIYLPPSMMGISDAPIAIDEQGNVQLADGTVTTLRLEGDVLMLGEYPVSSSDSYVSLTLAEDVELDYMTETAWYRRQLQGDWQLVRIEVPALGMNETVDPAITDVTLNIDSGNWCMMDGREYRLSGSFYDVTEYSLSPLHGDDSFTLTIASLSTLRIVPDSGSYTLTFTRIVETEVE